MNKQAKAELPDWWNDICDDWKTEEWSQLTEAEIKKDFNWAWQFAKEVEE